MLFLIIVSVLTLLKDWAKAWSDKWVNMGKVRSMYTRCQVIKRRLILVMVIVWFYGPTLSLVRRF